MFLILSLALAADEADCEFRPSNQDLAGTIALAEDAFANLDAKGFGDSRDVLLGSIECASEVISSSSAAGFFRVRALDAHLRKAIPDVRANTQAMADIEPTPPSSSVIPRGHPVRNAWEAARAKGGGETQLLAVPSAGRVIIDGRDTLEFPKQRPSLVQFVEPEGVAWTRLVIGTPPTYEEATDDMRKQYENQLIIAKPRKPVELPVIAAVLAAGAIGVYGASLATHRSFKRGDSAEEIRSAAATTNVLYFTSTGLAVGAVGIGAYAAARW